MGCLGSSIWRMEGFAMYRYRTCLLVALFIMIWCPLSGAVADTLAEQRTVAKVAILPFEIYSSQGVRTLQEQIGVELAAGLTESGYIELVDETSFRGLIEGEEGNGRLALLVGERTGAGFVITGSVTKLGDMFSADVNVTDSKSGHRSTFFAQGKSINALIDRLKNDILLKILTGQRIAEVRLVGNTRIENDAIYNVLKGTRGSLFSKERLSSDIKAIYKMGYFKDVKAKVTESSEGKIIVFTLEELPLVTGIEITGTDRINKGDIEGLITVKERQILNLDKVRSDLEQIKTFYKNEGYLNSQVTYRLDEQQKGVRVVFDIQESKELYIKEITFEGNRAYRDKDLKEMMETSEWGVFHFVSKSGSFNETLLKQDINRLTVFYLNNGYINAAIGEPEITHDRKWIYLKIPITEGKQFRVGEVTITGDAIDIPQAELMERLQITGKDYFDREAIIKDVDILTEACKDEGYAYATVVPRTVPRNEEQKINVVYHMEKGSLVYINRISITGNTKTRDKVIRRELKSIEGDLYDSSKFKTSYMKLNSLRYFEEINFQTEKGPDEGLMDITVNVREKATNMISVGAGYSAVDHMVLMAQISQKNVFGRGQTLNLSAYLGGTKTNYELSFVEPWLFDIPLWSKFDLWNMERDYDSYNVDTKGFGTTLGYHLFEKVTGYVGYELKTNNVYDIEDGASNYIKKQ